MEAARAIDSERAAEIKRRCSEVSIFFSERDKGATQDVEIFENRSANRIRFSCGIGIRAESAA